VIHNPEVLSTIRELPELKSLLDSYAKCDYKGFFVALSKPQNTLTARNKKDSFSMNETIIKYPFSFAL